jgi:ribosomal protein S18 acetylase RimI-like enzyme
MPENKLGELWNQAYMMTNSYKNEVALQAKGILSTNKIPPAGRKIRDAFRMRNIEHEQSILDLQKTQLKNILVMKRGNEIISSVRVIPVDNDWQLVSLVTKKEYRRRGLGSLMVKVALKEYPRRPLYSFQTVDKIPFYMELYRSEKPIIPKFYDLPAGMRCDLLYVNFFWGPYTIIRIDGHFG